MKLFLQTVSLALVWQTELGLLRAQETVPYALTTSAELDLVGFPLQLPFVDTGEVTSASESVVLWKPGFQKTPFAQAIQAGQEFFADIVGPAGHPWLGHRFELNESATRARSDHGLVVEPSLLNTRGLPSSDLLGATVQVRPHLSIPFLTEDTIERRVMHGAERAESFQFFLPAPAGGTFWAIPFVSGKGGTFWVDQKTLRTIPSGQLLIPLGSCLGVSFGKIRGLAVGLSGDERRAPTAKPLSAGFNFASYPYPKDLRLGLDWGGPSSGFRGGISPRGADRIEISVGIRRLIYSPEILSNGKLRWRLVDPVRRHEWKQPAEYLNEIPAGQGFLIWKNQPDPEHFFYPPKP